MTAILRPAPVLVTAGAAHLTVMPAMADVWIEALTAGDPVRAIVPGMCDAAGQEDLALALVHGRATAGDIIDAAWSAMAAAGGREWWVVMRLARVSVQPDVFATMLLDGLRPDTVTLAAWLACTYRVCTRNSEEKDRNQFDFDLLNPPPGVAMQQAAGFDSVQF